MQYCMNLYKKLDMRLDIYLPLWLAPHLDQLKWVLYILLLLTLPSLLAFHHLPLDPAMEPNEGMRSEVIEKLKQDQLSQ